MPIHHRGRLHGVLNIETCDDFFTAETCAVFDAAHQVAGAIHLAGWWRSWRRLTASCANSTVDGFPACQPPLPDDACRDCADWRGPLALLLVDADCFKQLNDALGHLHGDECLRRLARICAGFAADEADLAARYGGDELALVLPGRGEAEAMAIAERLRQRVEEAAMAHPVSVVAPWVTVSVGVNVAAPGQARTPARLLSGADRALYAAKSQGRNRLAAAMPPRDGNGGR